MNNPRKRHCPSAATVTEKKSVDLVFDKPHPLTDVTFEVGGRHLHFWKLLLRLASPVFDRMFTSDFKEKTSSVIPLPDKSVEDMDMFLQNLHPAYAWKPMEDEALHTLLRLADEYQTEHVRQKCLHHIDQQAGILLREEHFILGCDDEASQLASFYLFLCDQFQLQDLRKKIISVTSMIPMQKLEREEFYKRLSDATKIEALRERCSFMEKKDRTGF